MAFENGSNVYNYFLDMLLLYEHDAMIFVKAAQVIDRLTGTSEFPFNGELIEDATRKILGSGIYSMAPAAEWYVSGQLRTDLDGDDVEDIKDSVKRVPPSVRARFLDELSAFCMTYGSLMAQLYSGTAIDMAAGLKTIMVADSPENHHDQIIRFVRMDGEHFDIMFSEESAQKLAHIMDFVAHGDRP